MGKRAETDGATLTVLFLFQESHGCSTSCIQERAGLSTFCSTHIANLCPSGFKSWQWTCSFYFCPRIQLLQCQLTLFLPSPYPCGAGHRKPHIGSAYPPCPASASLESSAFGFLGVFFSHPVFIHHPTLLPRTPLYPVFSPACTSRNPAPPAHQATQDDDVSPQRHPSLQQIGKIQ